ncbi:von Willebrand factor A domain-containing protein 7-like isoform X2 [Ostrea edulis]|uniref:von Willebrand factor A domain-containing protein 7-like isoform X2 n=1 Tax=Ostrea edulis TaxID=37623 RepID=UPI002094C69C|nr:von Willebrand factor A domain-containing protein 7-like isoform X2 [Ostrea edulis]
MIVRQIQRESGLCINNTISTHNLTSGYRSGQDISKPLTTAHNSGKCSHGSSDDTSRFQTATGGIYKGRASAAHAPHYHLHDTAFEAAKQATIYFLSDGGNGLFNNMGFDLVREVFQVISKKEAKKMKDYSIAFAIDVTGSMSDNIRNVITATTTFVDLIRVSEFVPEKYVLVTFSDPVELETNHTTANPDEMMSMLNSLSVSGGADCPEYSISGLITAATLSNRNSSVYVYTDASAKDSDREETAIEILQEKSIRAHFRLTSECSMRRKRGTGRYKRQSSVYDRIAQSSGGTAVRLTTAELQAKVEEDLRNELQIIQSNSSQILDVNHLPSFTSLIKWRTIDLDHSNLTIEVDETVSSLDIKINGTIDASEVFLRNPSGSVVVLGSQNATLQDDGFQTTVSIEFPEKGVWTLEKQARSPWSVNITANSTFGITVSLLALSSDGSSYPVKGNPILGHEYLFVTVLENLPTNYTVSYIVCVNEDGQVLSQLNASLLSPDPVLQYFAKLKVSTKITGVQVHGVDSAGRPFIRTAAEAVHPVAVQLSMQPFIEALSLSTTEQLVYTITNHGVANTTVTFVADDDQGYITGNKSTRFVIPSGDSVQESLDIRGTIPFSIVTVTMKVYEDAALTELQSLEKKLMVSAVTRPSCNVTSSGESCRSSAFGASNCSAIQWQGSGRIEFSGTTLTSLYMSSSSVTLTHPSLESADGSVDVSLNGDCCSSSVVLSAVDVDGFIAQCRYTLYSDNDDQPNTIIDSPAHIESKNVLDLTIVGGAIGGSLAGIIIVSVVVFMKLHHTPTTKTSPITDVDLSDVKRPDKIRNTHFLPTEKSTAGEEHIDFDDFDYHDY